MLPANEWWGILGAYGAAVWPAQYEDTTMFGVGIYALVMLVRHWKAKTLAAVSDLIAGIT